MHGGVMFGWMWLLWVALGVGLLVLLLLLVRGLTRRDAASSGTPEEDLKRRFARGDINEQEYQRALEQLRQ